MSGFFQCMLVLVFRSLSLSVVCFMRLVDDLLCIPDMLV